MTNINPGDERWTYLVAEGIKRDGNRNWFLGDAALEIAPMGDDGAHNGSGAKLDAYADAVGVERSSLDLYRRVAAAWVPSTRVLGTSHKVHQMLMGHRELIRPGMTVTEAHRALGHSTTGRTGPQSPVAQRTAQARALLADPDVVGDVIDAIAADPTHTARVIARAEETRPAPAPRVTDPSPLAYVAALGVGSTALRQAGALAADVSTLVAALRNDEIVRHDEAAFADDAARLREAARTLSRYADELDIARTGAVTDESLNALLDAEGGM